MNEAQVKAAAKTQIHHLSLYSTIIQTPPRASNPRQARHGRITLESRRMNRLLIATKRHKEAQKNTSQFHPRMECNPDSFFCAFSCLFVAILFPSLSLRTATIAQA